MTGLSEDPLYVILRSKREATRFQILVEIAEHQPAIRQQEIAEKLGVTPQAVSEYIRELVDEGLVTAHGRGRYEVTKSGIEWVLRHAEALESYARHVNRDIIQQVAVWTAIAREEIRKGDRVGVFMQDGWLYAAKEERSATGIATMDAQPGEDLGVAQLNGIIDHEEGLIHVCKVPRVESADPGRSARISSGMSSATPRSWPLSASSRMWLSRRQTSSRICSLAPARVSSRRRSMAVSAQSLLLMRSLLIFSSDWRRWGSPTRSTT